MKNKVNMQKSTVHQSQKDHMQAYTLHYITYIFMDYGRMKGSEVNGSLQFDHTNEVGIET